MSSFHWDPNTAIVPFDPEAINISNDSSVGERLKSRRSTRSDRCCLLDAVKIEDSGSSQDPPADPKKNPKSFITSNSVAQISRTFGLPLSFLRIPNASDRPMDVGPEEIAVYEAMFNIGHLNKGDDVAGKRTIEQLLEIPYERRSLEFLSSHLALERNAIWDCNMSESQRASAPDPFELFLAASGKLAKMGGSAPASESQVKVTEVPRCGTMAVGKRKAGRSPCDPAESRRVMFSFCSVETKLVETVEESSKDHEAFILMRERCEVERKRGTDQLATIDAKDKEIKDLKVSAAGYEQAKEELQKRVDELIKDDELKDEEVKSLKRKNELLQAEYDFFLGGSAVKEYLAGQHLSWDLEGLDRRYAQVIKAQAQFKGLPAPEMVESLMALNDAPPS
ncbi:unnamed protein product [Cochlearia groenlandica]